MRRWGKRVEVVSADMRQWQAPVKADILVSELLGSFGDNELSPECLDGAASLLAPNGVSIPCRYTSFLQPITASKPWSDARVRGRCGSSLAGCSQQCGWRGAVSGSSLQTWCRHAVQEQSAS